MASGWCSPEASAYDDESQEEAFSQFDVVKDYSDHAFRAPGSGACGSAARDSRIYKNIMKEWRMLQGSLPEGIYVRAYEDRIDLLRAVIIGTKGTPYHDGLFFFDIAFPSNYPDSPPLFSYRSYGIQVNPNLYDSGKLCLSILNTWIGSGCEKWDHSRSSVLQVLISIQGLVLNEKPYYNEPWIRPAWNWQRYNESVFGLSCLTMVYVLRYPPKNFRTFVNSHFRKRASSILKAIHAYKDGAFVAGMYQEDKLSPATKKVSREFQRTLVDKYSKLFPHFVKIGAPVQHFKPPVLENEVGIIDKIISVLKKLWNCMGMSE